MENNKTNVKNYISIAFGALAGQGVLMMLVTMYLQFAYTEYIGLSAAAVGLVLGIGAVIDGLSDLGCGVVMDNYRTKWGKARHWFLYMALPLALSGSFLVACPASWSTTAKIVFLFVVYNIYCTALTFVRLPASTLVALGGRSEKYKRTGGLINAFFASFAVLLASWIITPMLNVFGGQSQHSYLMVFAIVSIISGAMTLAMFFLSREVVTEDTISIEQKKKQQGEQVEKASIKKQLYYLFTNKYWLIQLAGQIGANFATGLSMGCMAYFCAFVLNNPGAVALLMSVSQIPMLIGIFFGGAINAKIDPRYTCLIGWGIDLAGCLIMWGFALGGNGLTILMVGMAISKFGLGIQAPSTMVFSARISTYGVWKNGYHMEGMAFTGKDVMIKIMSALSSTVLGFILTAVGYSQGNCPPLAVKAITFMFVYLPAIGAAATLIAFCFFNLTAKKTAEMEEEIKQRTRI